MTFNDLFENRDADVENRGVDTGVGGMNLEIGIDICALLCVKHSGWEPAV